MSNDVSAAACHACRHCHTPPSDTPQQLQWLNQKVMPVLAIPGETYKITMEQEGQISGLLPLCKMMSLYFWNLIQSQNDEEDRREA